MLETDEELMLRLRRRDDDAALMELMQRYQGLLVNHFAKRGVHHEYEDLAQETFFRIYKARKRYKVTASFKTWMFRIAQRVWLDYVRKSSRRNRRENAFREEPRATHAVPDSMDRHDIHWALAQLPQTHRDVVVFSSLEQLSHKEISGILSIPEGTVKSRLHTALRDLRHILEQEEPAS
jgi:RNA polymerase sigma-70 factor (ECF subfamily)